MKTIIQEDGTKVICFHRGVMRGGRLVVEKCALDQEQLASLVVAATRRVFGIHQHS